MRRTLRALSVVAVAGAALGGGAPGALADPAAEVGPSPVRPGGTVTVSVTCDSTGGPPPDTIDATSRGFEDGTVRLRRVPGGDGRTARTTYRGTARVTGEGRGGRGKADGEKTDGGGADDRGADGRGADGGGADGWTPDGARGGGEQPDGGGPDGWTPDQAGPDGGKPDGVRGGDVEPGGSRSDGEKPGEPRDESGKPDGASGRGEQPDGADWPDGRQPEQAVTAGEKPDEVRVEGEERDGAGADGEERDGARAGGERPDRVTNDAENPDEAGADTQTSDPALGEAEKSDAMLGEAEKSGQVLGGDGQFDGGGPGGREPGGGFGGGGRDSAWTVDGTCPAPPGGRGRPWSATFTVDPGAGQPPPCRESRTGACDEAAVTGRGVHAGEGGTFTPSVPLLVAGGVLIAGALGGAVHRLRRGASARDT